MSPEIRAVILLLHLLSMLFMAAPLYMLIIVNERARFNVPLRSDVNNVHQTFHAASLTSASCLA